MFVMFVNNILDHPDVQEQRLTISYMFIVIVTSRVLSPSEQGDQDPSFQSALQAALYC